MIEKKLERKIAYIHAAYGLVAGLLFGAYFKGPVLPFLSVLMWGFIVSYPAMVLTKSVFKLPNEDYNIKSWLGKGFIYFFFVWIVAWAFMHNLA